MKLLFLFATLLTAIIIFISCKKDYTNKKPIANAGPDQVITLPTDSISLDGSASNDPDGTISKWLWTKISGPDSFSFYNRSYFDYASRTIVKNLFPGCYQFALRVTDADGLISRDTMQVIVLADYDLDINLEGTFSFSDNLDDGDGSYYDLVSISGMGNFAPIGQFEFDLFEASDSTTASNRSPSFARLSAAGPNNSFLYIPFIRGQCFVFLKQLIQGGGGAFTGTFKVNEGTASPCKQSIYTTLAPLEISGSMDTTAHTINLNIKGKIYF